MKTKNWLYGLLLVSFVAFVGCDDDDDGDNGMALNETDRQFAERAAMNNMAEIEMGALAAAKGESETVQQYGSMMVEDHTTAQDELEDLADDYNNVDWPDDLDQEHQELWETLNGLEGWQFDSAYISSQVMAHEEAVMLFEDESTNGEEEQFMTYADKYLPALQTHLQEAQEIWAMLMEEDGTDDGTDGN